MPSTIQTPGRDEFIEKKSRFIGFAFSCDSKQKFQNLLEDVETEFPDARHIAYAYKFKENGQVYAKFHDAGEPSGTAGRPIFNFIEGDDLLDVAIFVVRFFGGIKLGAGGLVRAYGHGARLALNLAEKVSYVEYVELELDCSYDELNRLEHRISEFNGRILRKDFDLRVRLQVEIPEERFKEFETRFE